MNMLPPAKAKHLYRLLSYGHGIRESARLAGVNRKTVQRYRADWMCCGWLLQRAYDALCEGDGEGHDKLVEKLPRPMVTAMGEAWLDDQLDQPKSVWHSGFESFMATASPSARKPLIRCGEGDPAVTQDWGRAHHCQSR